MASFGLRPVRTMGGSTWEGQCVTCLIPSTDATNYFVGDPVVGLAAGGAQLGITAGFIALGAGASQEDLGFYPQVGIAAAAGANRIYGVIVSFEAGRADLSKQYGLASTVRIVRVAPAYPDTVFEVYEDGTGALTGVGNTMSLAAGAGGSVVTGYSSWVLAASTAGTGSLQTIAVGVSNRLGNVSPGSVNCVWEVVIAQPQISATQLGAGI